MYEYVCLTSKDMSREGVTFQRFQAVSFHIDQLLLSLGNYFISFYFNTIFSFFVLIRLIHWAS